MKRNRQLRIWDCGMKAASHRRGAEDAEKNWNLERHYESCDLTIRQDFAKNKKKRGFGSNRSLFQFCSEFWKLPHHPEVRRGCINLTGLEVGHNDTEFPVARHCAVHVQGQVARLPVSHPLTRI